MSLIGELKRRRVFRVAFAYLAASWLLIQVLETLFPIFGIPATSIRVVVILLAIGLVPTVALAWVFQWTPSGLKRDSELPRAQAAAAPSRSLDRVIILVLSAAVVYFAIDRFVIRPGSESATLTRAESIAREYARRHPRSDRSVAVMPFTTDDDDDRELHFAAGLGDQVRINLAGVDRLRVIAKSSVAPYTERERSPAQLGEVLNVDQLLYGHVRRSSDRVVISVELVDTRSGQMLWANSFDEDLDLDDVLDIHDRVASSVAGALSSLDPSDAASAATTRPASLEALNAYHDGIYYATRLIQGENLDEDEKDALAVSAVRNYNDAINADPEWAPPRAMLGRLYHVRFNDTDDPGALALSRRHISDALRLDARFAPARSSHAYLLTLDRQFDAALEEFDQSIALGSDDAWWGLGVLYRYLGRHSDAVEALQNAVTVDPLIVPIRWQLAESYYCAGEYEAAIEDIVSYFPPADDDVYTRNLLANAYARTGDTRSALQMADSVVAQTGEVEVLAAVYETAGEQERARRAIAAIEDGLPPFVVLDVAPGLIMLGDTGRALTMLEESADVVIAEFDLRDQMDWIWRLRCPAEIQSLAGNPRYAAILDRFGLPN